MVTVMKLRGFLSAVRRFQSLIFVVLAIASGTAIVAASAKIAGGRAEAALRKHADETLRLQTQTILGHLEKYRHLPAIMARRPDVIAIAKDWHASEVPAQARRIVRDVAILSGAIDAALVSSSGEIIATANNYLDTAMIANGELLKAPREGRLGRASISGDNRRRSYAFSSAIRDGNTVIAVFVVAAPLETIEQTWALSANPIFTLNKAGQLAVGNELARARDGDVKRATEEGWSSSRSFASGDGDPFMAFVHDIPIVSWRLYVLESRTSVIDAQKIASLIAALATALAAAAGFILLTRRREARRKRRRERAAAIRLERKVRHRTRELREANARLEIEVDERRNAEAALRKAQRDLIQTAKLAALGQMSAGLSHEFNQPLAAAKTYAENAGVFLERGRLEDAKENVGRIAALVDRMAVISRHLRNFARKPNELSAPVPVRRVIGETLEILSGRFKSARAHLLIEMEEQELYVLAGHVRLQQVLMNIIANAADAAEAGEDPRIHIAVSHKGGQIMIAVRDHGRGVAPEIAERIFDPFFTTKGFSAGLGLGLSISYNIVTDFGGTLTFSNHPGGGAVFAITLRTAQTPAAQAPAAQVAE